MNNICQPLFSEVSLVVLKCTTIIEVQCCSQDMSKGVRQADKLLVAKYKKMQELPI